MTDRIMIDLNTLEERLMPSDEFKVTKEFLQGLLDGQQTNIVNQTFTGFFKDFINELLGREPEGIEGILLFNQIRFDLYADQNKASFTLLHDGKDIAYIECEIDPKYLGSITLTLEKGFMQMNIK